MHLLAHSSQGVSLGWTLCIDGASDGNEGPAAYLAQDGRDLSGLQGGKESRAGQTQQAAGREGNSIKIRGVGWLNESLPAQNCPGPKLQLESLSDCNQ